MDTLQVIALIVVALIILAVIIRYRRKLAFVLEFFGIKLDVQAEDQTGPKLAPPQPAGVRVRDLESRRGISIEGGHAHDPKGVGIEAENLKAEDDILIGPGESGDPKAQPPA